MNVFRCPAALAAAFLVLGVSAVAAATVPASKAGNPARLDAQAAGISSYVLPNGFKIILVPFPSAANARIELLVKTGSKLEGYGETGMAHLLEHMLFKSAGKRLSVKSDLTALGATWNGTTDENRTNFFETVAAEPRKIDEAIRIEADRFIRAGFTQSDLASEMTVVRNELERSDSDPDRMVAQALQHQSFFWHGYARPTIGARSDIEDAPFAALQAFHKKHYRPDNAALIVSGNFDARRVLALAGRLFGEARNPPGPPIRSWTREEARATTNRSELLLPAATTIAASAWKLPGWTARETYAFDLASSAICDDDWGSLRKDLVLARKLAVSVSCDTRERPDYSLFSASATAGKDADAEALSSALIGHLEAVAASGISQDDLDRVRLNQMTLFERLENSHEALAHLLAANEVAGDWRLYFWQRDTLKNISLEEANAALKKWLVAVNRSDVLLRHADGVSPPAQPKTAAAADLIGGKDWPVVAQPADPIPSSVAGLAKATSTVLLGGGRAQAALISRRTRGDMAWLVLRNDYGNESTLSGRTTACSIADSLVAYGGAGLTRDQLSAKLEALHATWSLGLGRIGITAPRRNIEEALDILLAAWADPALPENEFERIKAGRIAGIETGLTEPGMVAATAGLQRFDNYPAQHPLKPRSLEQRLAEDNAVTYAEVKACVADFSGIAKVRLAMVGAFTPLDAQAVWEKIAKLPAARIPYARVQDLEAPLVVDTTPINVAMPDKPNAAIRGSTLLRISDDAPDFPALRIAVKALGGDADSRIWKRLREHAGLAYSAGATLTGSHFEPRSRLSIQASAASPNADTAMELLQDELARALKEGFSVQEVERAKTTWREELKTSLRDEGSFANSLVDGLYSGRDYAWLARYEEKISRLTAQEVTSTFRKYLSAAPIVWMIGRGS